MTKLRATRLRVLRRPDGVIELRRRRLRDSVAVKDAAMLVGLCFLCIGFIAVLATLLVETPMVLAATGALVLPVVPAVLLARGGELAPAAAPRRSPRPPNSAA
jgi:hypothetical protein